MQQILSLTGTLCELAWMYVLLFALRTWMYIANSPYEAVGAALGLLGALVLAINGKHASLGWLGFLGSNIALIVFAARAGLYGVLTLQLGFMVTSLIGVWQGLLKPLLRNANLSPPATKEQP